MTWRPGCRTVERSRKRSARPARSCRWCPRRTPFCCNRILLQDQSSLDDIPQIQTGINIEEIHAQTPPASLRRHGLSDSLLRIWNMVTEPRTRKNDSIDATQDATPHHSDEKKIQKKLKSKLLNIKLRKEMMTRQKIVALMMKAVMVRAPNLKMIWTAE